MRSMKKKTVFLSCAVCVLLFAGCGKNTETADVNGAAPVESVAEAAQESIEETAQQSEEASEEATPVSEVEESEAEEDSKETSEEPAEDASDEDAIGEAANDDNDTEADTPGDTASAPAQESVQATDGLQMVEGSEYIPDYYMWCPVGDPEIYQPEPFGYGYAIHYYFR